MVKVKTPRKADTTGVLAAGPDRVYSSNVKLMQEISAKFGAATSVISVGFAPAQEPTVIQDIASLVAPRFNAWKASGIKSSDELNAREGFLRQAYRDYALPESDDFISVLDGGEAALPVDFPVFVFDTGLGLRRSVVLNGRLELMTANQVASRLSKLKGILGRAQRLAASSRISTGEIAKIAQECGLPSNDLDEIREKLGEQSKVLIAALNSMADLNIDLAAQHEDELMIGFLDWLGAEGSAPAGIYVALDFHTVLIGDKQVSEIQRRLKNLAHHLPRVHRRLILAGSKTELPDYVAEGLIPGLSLELPGQEELTQRIEGRLSQIAEAVNASQNRDLEFTLTDDGRTRLHRAAQGLTVEEVDTILTEATVGATVGTDRPVVISDELVDKVNQAKVVKLEKLGVEFAPKPDVSAGGMPALKADLERFKRRFWLVENPTEQAQKLKVTLPKGILIAGATGTGKSLIAKSMARDWGVPLLKLSIGSLYSKYVGETDERFRTVRRLIEGCAPCIVLIDELDKALGSAVGHTGDSGTSDRLLGELLTWMQERQKNIYFVATANDVRAIQASKPELLRKGRWDQIYFVDLPNNDERREILEFHLAAHNSSLEPEYMEVAVAATANMVGAEIGFAVESAIDLALEDNRDHLTHDDVCTAAQDIRPIALSTERTIESLRRWAQDNAKFASGHAAAAPAVKAVRQGDIPGGDKQVII